jgi:hypothetical protein
VGKDSKMKRGLPQISKEHPILFIGNHTFVGLDLPLIVNAFLEDQNVMIRSLAHPALTAGNYKCSPKCPFTIVPDNKFKILMYHDHLRPLRENLCHKCKLQKLNKGLSE